jgi:hypothetical protein
MTFSRWANGNNAAEGISMFVQTHICNELCIQLKLELPNKISIQGRTTSNSSHIPTLSQPQRLSGRIAIPERPHIVQISSSLPVKSSLSHIINHTEGALPSGWSSKQPATTTS